MAGDDGIVCARHILCDEFEGQLEKLFQEVNMRRSRTRSAAAAIIGLAGVAAIAQTSTPPAPQLISVNGTELGVWPDEGKQYSVDTSHAMSFDNPVEFNRAVMGFIGQHATRKP